MLRPFLIATLSLAIATPAAAWTRPGHMVTAAIAYDQIQRERPDLLPMLEKLLDAHPDRGPFQVAIDRTTGAERARRMFLECARWPDDVRQTPHDRPSWHASLSPVIAPDAPAQTRERLARRGDVPTGGALPALAMNQKVLSDGRASPGERAMALCWVLHVAADIHQPLHTAELFSAAFPYGDGGGSRQYVKDPLGPEVIALHWLWDDSIHRSGVAADVDKRAREIEAAHPRSGLKDYEPGVVDFAAWAKAESYPLAVSFAYGANPPWSTKPESAPPVPDAYWRELRKHAEVRVALAGYRMADAVVAALDAAAR